LILAVVLYLQFQAFRLVRHLLEQQLQICGIEFCECFRLCAVDSQLDASFADLEIITHEPNVVDFLRDVFAVGR
jgi:hypothetical protein